MSGPEHEQTDFGFERVPWQEKAGRVRAVFDSVVDRYDLMNDLMSGGAHRLWKRFALSLTGLRPGMRALDVAGGTGDLAAGLARQVGRTGLVILSDINAVMLARGRDRLINEGCVRNTQCVQANAECLPFAPGSFDCITIGFGLRNVTDKARALASMHSALKPGARVLILEFSKPVNPALASLYDSYSFSLLPRLGQLVAGDGESYRYLAESIRRHPDQETLRTMMVTAGFEQCTYHNLMGGIVAVHRGYRIEMRLRPISEALNRALADSTRAQALCAALAGRVLRVQVTGVAFALNVIVAPDHLELSTDGERPADVTIRGSAIALLGLLLGDASAQLRRGDAELIGDAELAQQFMALAELVRPDTETELARLIGPIGAHLLGRAARGAGGWGRQTLRTLIDNGAEYLAHERGVLIPRAEAEPFLRGVDALRERLDRLEAREGLLRSRLAAVPERGP